MSAVAYTVSVTFPTPEIMREYVEWLEDGHVDQVIAHGAHSAMIVELDRTGPKDPCRVEVRYIFPTRALFDRYIEQFAPGLRADGLKRFPAERGVTFERLTGNVI